MTEENLKIYENKLDYFLDQLDRSGISFRYCETFIRDSDGQPNTYLLLDKLKRWSIGIWATGEWSDYYDVDSESKFTIFMIHSWHLDKFRPSSADIIFELSADPKVTSDILEVVEKIKIFCKTQVALYESVFPERSWWWDYWTFEISKPFWRNLRYSWSPLGLYWILRTIAILDPRVQSKKTLYHHSPGYPRYTFGFLATPKCSEDDNSFEGFYNLYSRFPRKLARLCKGKLFNATWNVSDHVEGMDDKAIKKRLWKGIYLED